MVKPGKPCGISDVSKNRIGLNLGIPGIKSWSPNSLSCQDSLKGAAFPRFGLIFSRWTIGLYNYKTDPDIRTNLKGKFPGIQQPLETRLRAILQTYNERLIDNNMAISSE